MPDEFAPEYTEKPAWNVTVRESIYDQLRAIARAKTQAERVEILNEIVLLLYVSKCDGETPEGVFND